MTSDDWEGAISLLVSNLHRPDQKLLVLLQRCVAGQPIASMEEAQALLLKNFRVGKGTQSAQTPKPAGRLHYLVVFPIHKVKRVKLRLVTTSGPEFAKEVDCSASYVHGKPPRRLQTDFPYQVLMTSGHTTVRQNKVTLQVRCLAMLQQWL